MSLTPSGTVPVDWSSREATAVPVAAGNTRAFLHFHSRVVLAGSSSLPVLRCDRLGRVDRLSLRVPRASFPSLYSSYRVCLCGQKARVEPTLCVCVPLCPKFSAMPSKAHAHKTALLCPKGKIRAVCACGLLRHIDQPPPWLFHVLDDDARPSLCRNRHLPYTLPTPCSTHAHTAPVFINTLLRRTCCLQHSSSSSSAAATASRFSRTAEDIQSSPSLFTMLPMAAHLHSRRSLSAEKKPTHMMCTYRTATFFLPQVVQMSTRVVGEWNGAAVFLLCSGAPYIVYLRPWCVCRCRLSVRGGGASSLARWLVSVGSR